MEKLSYCNLPFTFHPSFVTGNTNHKVLAHQKVQTAPWMKNPDSEKEKKSISNIVDRL